MIRVETYVAPAAWASYLVNGDDSGLEDEDLLAARAFESSLPGNIVNTSGDEFFSWCHDASRYMPLGATCTEYVVYY